MKNVTRILKQVFLNQKGLGGKFPHQVCFEFWPVSLGRSVMLRLEGESVFVCSYQKFAAFLYNRHFSCICPEVTCLSANSFSVLSTVG